MIKVIATSEDMERLLTRIAHEILEKYPSEHIPAVVGIRTRGAFLAQRIADRMEKIQGKKPPLGILDINLYRDDLTRVAEQPIVRKTEIPFNIDDRIVVLVDDVLYTGRTIRSAMDALTDLGRPKAIRLVVLVDRGHRELPIRADFVGKNIPTGEDEIVHVRMKEYDGKDEVVVEGAK